MGLVKRLSLAGLQRGAPGRSPATRHPRHHAAPRSPQLLNLMRAIGGGQRRGDALAEAFQRETGAKRSTQVGLARLAHILAPISGKPEIGVCSAPPATPPPRHPPT